MHTTFREQNSLLKVFYMVLCEGLSNAQAKQLMGLHHLASMDRHKKAFIKAVSNVMNWEILGSEHNQAQWKLPIENEKGESMNIGIINMENYHGQHVMCCEFEKLIDQCIADDDKKHMWRYTIQNYISAMKILWQKTHYTKCDKEKRVSCTLIGHIFHFDQCMERT